MALTESQRRKITKLSKLGKQGNVALLEYLFEIEEKLDKEIPELTNLITRLKGDKGDSIKGDRGEQGASGKDGEKGDRGDRGNDGLNGKDGRDGIDGTDGVNGKDGRDGRDGKDGRDGLDAVIEPELLKQLKDIPDIKRLAQSSANNQALPVTTTFFSKNGQVLGRAKNINFIEGTNTTLGISIGGDTANITVTSTASGGASTIYSDTVSGTINSFNTVFTVSNVITSAIILSLANSVYQPGIDFTVTGPKQITMTIAPDSSLSGQPFWLIHT